jgi:hypothetical protein
MFNKIKKIFNKGIEHQKAGGFTHWIIFQILKKKYVLKGFELFEMVKKKHS